MLFNALLVLEILEPEANWQCTDSDSFYTLSYGNCISELPPKPRICIYMFSPRQPKFHTWNLKFWFCVCLQQVYNPFCTSLHPICKQKYSFHCRPFFAQSGGGLRTCSLRNVSFGTDCSLEVLLQNSYMPRTYAIARFALKPII